MKRKTGLTPFFMLTICAGLCLGGPMYAQQKTDSATPGASNAKPAATNASGGGSDKLSGDTGRQIIDVGNPNRGSMNGDDEGGNSNYGWLGLLGLLGLIGLKKRKTYIENNS